MGLIHREQGKLEQAIASFQKALDLNPDFSKARKELEKTQTALNNS